MCLQQRDKHIVVFGVGIKLASIPSCCIGKRQQQRGEHPQGSTSSPSRSEMQGEHPEEVLPAHSAGRRVGRIFGPMRRARRANYTITHGNSFTFTAGCPDDFAFAPSLVKSFPVNFPYVSIQFSVFP